MVIAFDRWMAIKAEHVSDEQAQFDVTTSTDPARGRLERDAVRSTLGPAGIPAHRGALHIASVMATATHDKFASSLKPGQAPLVDMRMVFASAFIDGLGLGAVYRGLADQEQRVALREKLLEAEERRDELAGESATLLEELDGAKRELCRLRTQLATAQAQARRTQPRARWWRRWRSDAGDRLRSTTGA